MSGILETLLKGLLGGFLVVTFFGALISIVSSWMYLVNLVAESYSLGLEIELALALGIPLFIVGAVAGVKS